MPGDRATVRTRWPSPGDLFAQIGEPKPLPVEADFLIGWRAGIYADGWLLCPDPQIVAGVQARCSATFTFPAQSRSELGEAPLPADRF